MLDPVATCRCQDHTCARLRYAIIADTALVPQLVDEAHHRWLVEEEGVVDDITAVVVMFNHGA